MPARYLNGDDVLVLWLASKQTWMKKLDPVDFSDDELAEIDRISQAFWDMQKKLVQRFGFDKFYV